MAHDIFISHARDDKPIADAVCATLEHEGVRCWIAPRDIRPGAEWSESIIDGIKHARVFVLVFSSRANTSGHVRREVERAVNHGLIVIPFRIEDVLPEGALEYHLGAVHWLDAMTPPLEAHIKRLAETARSILGVEVRSAGAARTSVVEPPIASGPDPARDDQSWSERRPLMEAVIAEQPVPPVAGGPVAEPPVAVPSAAAPSDAGPLPADLPRLSEASSAVEPVRANREAVVTFAYLIGSEGRAIDWPRAFNFLIALLVSNIAVQVAYTVSYGSPLITAQGIGLLNVQAAVAVLVFRYLPGPARAIAVTIVTVAARAVFFRTFQPTLWNDPAVANILGFGGADVLIFYLVVPWSVRRIKPTARALWLGAIVAEFWSFIAGLAMGLRASSAMELFTSVLNCVSFVLAFTAGLRILGRARSK